MRTEQQGLNLGDLGYVRCANGGWVENMPFYVRTIWTSPKKPQAPTNSTPTGNPNDILPIHDQKLFPIESSLNCLPNRFIRTAYDPIHNIRSPKFLTQK